MVWTTDNGWDTGNRGTTVVRLVEEDPYDEDYLYDNYHEENDINDIDDEDDSTWNLEGQDLTDDNEEECFLERMGIE